MLTEEEIKNGGRISPELKTRKSIVLTSILRNGRISDSDLMEPLELKSANAASYYRKDLESQGIIKGYTAIIDWKKLGYPTEFLVIIEGKDMDANFNVEKEIVASLEDYEKKNGDMFILPSGNGRVIIGDIMTCFGERPMTVIQGHATSQHDAIIYSQYYVSDKFTDTKITFLLIKGKGIHNFFINKEYINFMKGSFKEDKDLELPDEFKKRFPSLSHQKK